SVRRLGRRADYVGAVIGPASTNSIQLELRVLSGVEAIKKVADGFWKRNGQPSTFSRDGENGSSQRNVQPAADVEVAVKVTHARIVERRVLTARAHTVGTQRRVNLVRRRPQAYKERLDLDFARHERNPFALAGYRHTVPNDRRGSPFELAANRVPFASR